MLRADFDTFIKDNIRDYLQDYDDLEVKLQQVERTSGPYEALVIRNDDMKITPVINMDEMYRS